MSLFEAWRKAKPLLEPALEEAKGTHTIDDCAILLGAGQFRLWIGEKSALLTEFVQFPQMKVLNIFIGGGDMEELKKIRDEQLVPFAKANGCARLTGAGRKGWERALKNDGYTFGGIYMHRDL